MKVKRLHRFDLDYTQAVALQEKLRGRVKLQPLNRNPRFIAGCDISFNRGEPVVYAGVVVLDLLSMETVEEHTVVAEAVFPYIPGLLAFREIPPLLDIFEKVKSQPDVVICDGQGIAHPRRMGLASHLGLFLDMPTLGVAKSRLTGKARIPAVHQWSQTKLRDGREELGRVVRTRARVKPVYVSPGHLMDIAGAVKIVKWCCLGYRLPEPTRRAHLLVNKVRREAADIHS